MRSFLTFAYAAVLIFSAAPGLAQTTAAIDVEQPWARATPTGAQSGAAYMTLENKSSSADRLTGAMLGAPAAWPR